MGIRVSAGRYPSVLVCKFVDQLMQTLNPLLVKSLDVSLLVGAIE